MNVARRCTAELAESTIRAALLGDALGNAFDRDPHALAEWLGVTIQMVPGGVIAETHSHAQDTGSYAPKRRRIQLCRDLDPVYLRWIFCHELGHALILHEHLGGGDHLDGETACNVFAQTFLSGASEEIRGIPGATAIIAASLQFAGTTMMPEVKWRDGTVSRFAQFGRNYIEDAASVAAYGRRERVLVFKDILALGLTQADLTAASATLYALAVTYLLRHKDPQVAYEVDVVGLEHISGGVPTFKSGQTVRLDYEGTIETEDGREALISVDTDLYVMGYTRRFDDAGGSHWRFTVSTVARELPSDGQIFSDMMRELGVAKIAPLGDLTVGPANGAHIQLNSDGSFEIVGQSVRLTDDGLSLEVASDPDITGEAERKIRHTNDGFETAYGERYGARVDGLNSNYLVDRVFKATDSYLLRGVWDEATEAYDVSEFLAQSDTGFSEFWSINVGNATALGLRRIAADDFELYMLIGGVWTKIAG